MISRACRDDLSQEGDIAAWKAESTWNGSVPLSAWRAIKAKGARIDYIRSWSSLRRSVKFRELPLTVRAPAQESFSSCEPRLYRAIARLPVKYQEIVRLKFWYGMTHAEIAESIASTEAMVSLSMANIMKELKRTICITPEFSLKSSRLRYWQP